MPNTYRILDLLLVHLDLGLQLVDEIGELLLVPLVILGLHLQLLHATLVLLRVLDRLLVSLLLAVELQLDRADL